MYRFLKISLITVKILAYTVIGLMLLYATAFAVVGTVCIYKAYTIIVAPVKEVAEFQTVNPEKTSFMKQCLATLKTDTLVPDTLIHTFIPLDSISPNLIDAVLAAEDDGFYLHPGIDISSVLAALEYNKNLGKNKHGASTITQQMAKNLFLSSDRTFDRKIKELVYTILMERFLGKDRILELYMNYAQWGKNIFGCEAAAQFYYKKSAKKLSRIESARLAAVLAKPTSLSPLNTKSVFMSKRMAVIAQNLYLHHTIGDSEYYTMTGTMPPVKPEKDVRNGSGQKEKQDTTKTERQSF